MTETTDCIICYDRSYPTKIEITKFWKHPWKMKMCLFTIDCLFCERCVVAAVVSTDWGAEIRFGVKCPGLGYEKLGTGSGDRAWEVQFFFRRLCSRMWMRRSTPTAEL